MSFCRPRTFRVISQAKSVFVLGDPRLAVGDFKGDQLTVSCSHHERVHRCVRHRHRRCSLRVTVGDAGGRNPWSDRSSGCAGRGAAGPNHSLARRDVAPSRRLLTVHSRHRCSPPGPIKCVVASARGPLAAHGRVQVICTDDVRTCTPMCASSSVNLLTARCHR